jgi:hypothetical protein
MIFLKASTMTLGSTIYFRKPPSSWTNSNGYQQMESGLPGTGTWDSFVQKGIINITTRIRANADLTRPKLSACWLLPLFNDAILSYYNLAEALPIWREVRKRWNWVWEGPDVPREAVGGAASISSDPPAGVPRWGRAPPAGRLRRSRHCARHHSPWAFRFCNRRLTRTGLFWFLLLLRMNQFRTDLEHFTSVRLST